MGWFDNEQQDGKPAAPASQSAPSRPVSQSSTTVTTESGSTLGRQIQIDGTIVCNEDLTILGKVDGTIRAKGTLVIAKEADVHAKIDGLRVVVHGKVNGDVEGEERVVLGPTAHLMGNIHTPTLEIVEGARFKGSVEMDRPKTAEPVKKPAPTVAPKKEAAGAGDTGKPAPGPMKESSGGAAPVQKQTAS
ncbi:MAG: polymer-forming cytoskeletal protein [Acidobacteriota bacterium]|jgi:cytoskeletal protein CcmA (bactofilin family)